MAVKPLLPEATAIWSSRVAVAVAALCGLLGLVTGVTGVRFLAGATPSTLLLAGIGALLYAIWLVLLQLYFYGLRPRQD
ncbi:MAG: hypothetical protein HYY02_04335 [Chloroflexi bacterium]|nr:hypothetical protein [Chloroflexota bacterium]